MPVWGQVLGPWGRMKAALHDGDRGRGESVTEHSQDLHVPGIPPAWASCTPLSNRVATAFCLRFMTEQVSYKIREGRDFYKFSSKLYLWKQFGTWQA